MLLQTSIGPPPSPATPLSLTTLSHHFIPRSPCKFVPLFSTTSKMLLPQLLSFQTFASLPGGGYPSYPACPRNSRPPRITIFNELRTAPAFHPLLHPFVFKHLRT